MASCARCGAALIATARFCAACGSRVARPSASPPSNSQRPSTAPAPVTGAPPPAQLPDPFAKTVLGDAAAIAPPPVQPTQPMAPPVSPLASSVMDKPNQSRPVNVIATPWNVPPPSGPGPFAQQAPVPHGFGPGALVLVHWADGNRYPGTVLQVAGTQLLVSFPNGQQHWVDMKYVSSGS
jgi:hypothetical protein